MIIKSTSPRTTKGMELNGNVLSGDTFGVKDHIKANWDGKWDAYRKVWIVNPDKVIDTITRKTWGVDRILEIVAGSATTQPATKTTVNWAVNTKHGHELAEDF